MSDLKPCPFCGGEARAEEYGDGYIPQCDHKHTCVIADCEFPADEWYISEGFAIEAWNARWERTCHDDGIGVFRCDTCGAFANRDAVTDCCTTIPIRYCPNCGAKVVEP